MLSRSRCTAARMTARAQSDHARRAVKWAVTAMAFRASLWASEEYTAVEGVDRAHDAHGLAIIAVQVEGRGRLPGLWFRVVVAIPIDHWVAAQAPEPGCCPEQRFS